ncbi:MAG: cell wall hydrolase [Synechococcales cyanobacterium RM1_1_8]|nr:cell wall hydrolase [Synechococcales cyanobacterium RM1_1_8]
MGRIFLSAGHGGFENGVADPGAIAGGTTEAQEMIQLRDLMVLELRSRSLEVLSIPDDLSESQTTFWINSRARAGDVAFEIHVGSFTNPSLRGATCFYIANNDQRQKQAEFLLLSMLRRVPQIPSRGAQPDTATGLGRLSFCRDIVPASLLMEVAYLTNPDDRSLLQSQRKNFAIGLAEGLAAWSRAIASGAPLDPVPIYPTINIRINGQVYGEQGILISNNAYIPVDLVDSLKADLSKIPQVRRVSYRGVVYVKAVELRDFDISVGWERDSRTVTLQSILKICKGTIDRIMGHGNTSELQLLTFLKAQNEAAIALYPDLPRIYREEGSVEGVNYDIAFCQMCLETNFLRFSGTVKPAQNNFGGLGGIGVGPEGATFTSARFGVRAQVQHLKAYASTEPVVQEILDPRFRFVTRGVAPLLSQLSGRWDADLTYGNRILAIVRQLYESASIL